MPSFLVNPHEKKYIKNKVILYNCPKGGEIKLQSNRLKTRNRYMLTLLMRSVANTFRYTLHVCDLRRKLIELLSNTEAGRVDSADEIGCYHVFPGQAVYLLHLPLGASQFSRGEIVDATYI